jgi:hypothetical protein
VGDVRYPSAAGVLIALEGLRKPVEVATQAAKLVVARDRYPGGVIAGGESASGALKVIYRPDQALGEGEGEGSRQENHPKRDDQEGGALPLQEPDFTALRDRRSRQEGERSHAVAVDVDRIASSGLREELLAPVE